jgi:hypothetical protein
MIGHADGATRLHSREQAASPSDRLPQTGPDGFEVIAWRAVSSHLKGGFADPNPCALRKSGQFESRKRDVLSDLAGLQAELGQHALVDQEDLPVGPTQGDIARESPAGDGVNLRDVAHRVAVRRLKEEPDDMGRHRGVRFGGSLSQSRAEVVVVSYPKTHPSG